MRRRVRKLVALAFVGIVVILPAQPCCAAYIYDFRVFTSNSGYYDSLAKGIHVEVWDDQGTVNFTFYNDSAVQSSIVRIYFDDGSLFDTGEVINVPGTMFNPAHPLGKLPGGQNLTPLFEADREFSIGPGEPPPWGGVNNRQDEWVTASFELINGRTFDDVIVGLSGNALRIGLHIIGLPDGGSESAVLNPEPATVLLLGLGVLVLLRKRRA